MARTLPPAIAAPVPPGMESLTRRTLPNCGLRGLPPVRVPGVLVSGAENGLGVAVLAGGLGVGVLEGALVGGGVGALPGGLIGGGVT